MAFIAPLSNTPPPLTPGQIVRQLKTVGNNLLNGLNAYAVSSIKQVWTASSPQAVFAAMGTDGGSAVAQLSALISFLALPTVNYPVDPTVLALIQPLTVNPDGTVTVNTGP